MSETISRASVCEILADIYPTDGEKVVAVKEVDKAYEAISDIKSSYGEYSEKVDAAIVKDFLKISKSLGIIEY